VNASRATARIHGLDLAHLTVLELAKLQQLDAGRHLAETTMEMSRSAIGQAWLASKRRALESLRETYAHIRIDDEYRSLHLAQLQGMEAMVAQDVAILADAQTFLTGVDTEIKAIVENARSRQETRRQP